MGEDTNQIEREIVAERDRLGRNLNELETKTQQLGDWRTMDAAVQDFVKTRLVDDAAPAAMAVDGR